MSTNDVPGAVAANNDKLRQGCWAEHSDGSLIYVYDTEVDNVIYSMFDLSLNPVMEYRHRMPVGDFEKAFSCSRADIHKPVTVGGKTIKKELWTWHDKTPFPWDRIIKSGLQSVPKIAMAEEQISAAQRVARDLRLRGATLKDGEVDHMQDQERPKDTSSDIIARLGKAFDAFMNG